jgi:alpha-tubulin suppressor-like RCC1 family protein
VQLQCGDNVTFIVTAAGGVLGWGAGETNQLCTGNADDVHIPTSITFPFDSDTSPAPKGRMIKQLSVGTINCAALDDQGHVWVWGWLLGVQPTLVPSLANVKIESIAMGHNSMLLST